jgi:hypothetical protein
MRRMLAAAAVTAGLAAVASAPAPAAPTVRARRRGVDEPCPGTAGFSP